MRILMVLYPISLVILVILTHLQNRSLDKGYAREIEYGKQISTLIAENRRLRDHCPPEKTSGVLVRR